jgi:pimeloyl-ACP methyl ester carboxylesterase
MGEMANLLLLPATEPDDETYGLIPKRLESCPAATLQEIAFPTMVWYNKAVRSQAIHQIRALGTGPSTLVGFSKSGLGAWNILRAIPERISATIIFDAPVVREELPPWGTAPFYDGDESWQEDLPARTVEDLQNVVPATHRLVLISGEAFHTEMAALARALSATTINHVFLPRPHLKHHWRSGWLEEGLQALLRPGP